MDIVEKGDIATNLLERAAIWLAQKAGDLKNGPRYYSTNETQEQGRLRIAMAYLEDIHDMLCDESPDAEWLGEFYALSGDHMHLTEEGWVPAEMNTQEYTGYPPMEVLCDLNNPAEQAAEAT